MDCEADILKHRIKVIALDRRRIKAGKRIGGKEGEAGKGGSQQALRRQNQREQITRQAATEGGDHGAKGHKDEDPEDQ